MTKGTSEEEQACMVVTKNQSVLRIQLIEDKINLYKKSGPNSFSEFLSRLF